MLQDLSGTLFDEQPSAALNSVPLGTCGDAHHDRAEVFSASRYFQGLSMLSINLLLFNILTRIKIIYSQCQTIGILKY